MLPPIILLSFILQIVRFIDGEELSVIRHADGDIFTVEGSCNGACVELSSGTGSPYSRGTATTNTGISITNGTCVCQCNGALPIFREDLHICVSDIHECSVAGFVGNTGIVERVPYVFLPQRGQIIYPQAEIRFEGVTTPVCGIAGSQQLGKSGWLELRNLSNAEPPFRLFRDEGRTFLQWIGEDGLKDAAEGKVVVAKLVCRDASPNSDNPGVFIPCVAFRVAGSPSKSNIREVTFASTGKKSSGLSAIEYTAIGVSSILLALIYVASVSLYLHSRKARRKITEEPEVAITNGRDGAGLVKSNPLLVGTRHYDSDTNSVLSDDELADDIAQSDEEQGFENPTYCSQQVTSAIIHPHCVYIEHPEGPYGNGTILGERIPDENVRIVETIENAYQHETPVLPGNQRRKLYFNPAYFERQLLLAPPPAAIEFLMKIREVISIAKHKMTAKRFIPTLTGIPEEENSSDRCSSTANNKQTSNSIRGSVARSRKSQRCTGCPGCAEKTSKNLPHLPETNGRPMIGDSRVRAWLEDVKPPERRWNDANDGKRNFQENSRTFARSFEYLREMAKIDFLPSVETSNITSKSLATWKENPAMLRTFRNIARSEILEDDDRHSVSKRSTKSMFEESNYDRYYRSKKSIITPSLSSSSVKREIIDDRENTLNAKVRKAIENSFIKQMEENATIENNTDNNNDNVKKSIIEINEEDIEKHLGNRKKTKKSKAPDIPSDKLSLTMEKSSIVESSPPKRIMDAVIRELVDAKVLENCPKTLTTMTQEYEIDSLERTCRKQENLKITKTPNCTDEKMSLKLSNVKNSRKTMKDKVDVENFTKLSKKRGEEYSLVSEVYVNDGYASPAGSDDSGPEISYERENPGHLTIKVHDSPENYVKQDDSEYEPDTLDRKPMRLKINGDVSYEREKCCEIYVDSLERQGHISLKSRGSFRNDDDNDETKSIAGTLQRGYGSLREIYEARLRTNLGDSSIGTSTRSLNGDSENTLSWRRNKYLTPDLRQAKRQRKPQQNPPDVVPLPPNTEEIYQRPKPPRRVEYIEPQVIDNNPRLTDEESSKNALDRSESEAGDPAASDGSPVLEKSSKKQGAGNQSNNVKHDDVISSTASQSNYENFVISRQKDSITNRRSSSSKDAATSLSTTESNSGAIWRKNSELEWKIDHEKREKRHLATIQCTNDTILSKKHRHHVANNETACKNFNDNIYQDLRVSSLIPRINEVSDGARRPVILGKIEDSGYLSSSDSNGSRKQLLRHENNNDDAGGVGGGSVSETDETESMCDGASESGAESVGTDSVFFGNFRRMSEISNFSKSIDSGVDFGTRNIFFKGVDDTGGRSSSGSNNRERTSVRTSESESESFVTVLSPDGDSRRNSLVS